MGVAGSRFSSAGEGFVGRFRESKILDTHLFGKDLDTHRMAAEMMGVQFP
jgi:hypothetical protein